MFGDTICAAGHKDCRSGVLWQFASAPGHFEPQGEASQLAVELIGVKAGCRVLDFCAGAGGKSLAIAAQMGIKAKFVSATWIRPNCGVRKSDWRGLA